jgi:hypothetical protein
MNTDQRRALDYLKTIYPKALHQTLEKEYREFVTEKGDMYLSPTDLVEAYIKWLQR